MLALDIFANHLFVMHVNESDVLQLGMHRTSEVVCGAAVIISYVV